MPVFYLDTSALAKRYKNEPGTVFIDKLFTLLEQPEHKGATSFLTFLELLAMVTRLRKGKQITQDTYDHMLARILHDLHTYFTISPVSTDVLATSVSVIKTHALKAPDAQQLATALELRPILEQLGERLVFIADDHELYTAAVHEGLPAIHPQEKQALRRLKQLTKSPRRARG